MMQPIPQKQLLFHAFTEIFLCRKDGPCPTGQPPASQKDFLGKCCVNPNFLLLGKNPWSAATEPEPVWVQPTDRDAGCKLFGH